MLGNEVPLWETMLAAIKLGMVVIPATLLLSGPDLADRLARGRVRWILTNATGAARVADTPATSARATPRVASPTSAAPTTCSRPRATGSAPSSSRAR